jgi:hypothetical protein
MNLIPRRDAARRTRPSIGIDAMTAKALKYLEAARCAGSHPPSRTLTRVAPEAGRFYAGPARSRASRPRAGQFFTGANCWRAFSTADLASVTSR